MTDLTSDEIMAKLAAIRASESTLYHERRALEQEVERRQAVDLGEVYAKALLHERFGLSLRAVLGITIRIPDSDWMEGEPDIQDLATEVYNALRKPNMTATFQGHKYRIEDGGDRFHVRPNDSRDVDAWNALLAFVTDRLGKPFYELESLDIALPLVRAACRPKT